MLGNLNIDNIIVEQPYKNINKRRLSQRSDSSDMQLPKNFILKPVFKPTDYLKMHR
jgi:hypothetical protein